MFSLLVIYLDFLYINLMSYAFLATVLRTQIFNTNLLHNVYIYYLKLLYVSATNFSLLQGATIVSTDTAYMADNTHQCQSVLTIY
jgi:hypothetical protein